MKKVFSLLLIILPLMLLTVSCHDEEDPIVKTTPYSKFKGSWTGTYSGGDSGIINFSVKDDGTITGDIESESFPASDLTLKGKVTIEGAVNIRLMYMETTDIGGYIGTMTESNASGSWTNTSAVITGSWVAGR